MSPTEGGWHDRNRPNHGHVAITPMQRDGGRLTRKSERNSNRFRLGRPFRYVRPPIRAANAALDTAQTHANGTISLMDAHLNGMSSRVAKPSCVRLSPAGSRVAMGPPSDQRTRKRNMQPINRYCGPPAHATKWTVVVDRPREARTLTLFDTQAEVHAEIIRLRERGLAHVFALAVPTTAVATASLSPQAATGDAAVGAIFRYLLVLPAI